MTAVTLNLEIERGRAFRKAFRLQVEDPDTKVVSPVDFTGKTFLSQARTALGRTSPLITDLTVAPEDNDPTTGWLEITLTIAETDSIDEAHTKGVFDIVMMPDGVNIAKGSIRVVKSSTVIP